LAAEHLAMTERLDAHHDGAVEESAVPRDGAEQRASAGVLETTT
jgi:hypothetical protein